MRASLHPSCPTGYSGSLGIWRRPRQEPKEKGHQREADWPGALWMISIPLAVLFANHGSKANVLVVRWTRSFEKVFPALT